MSDSPTICGMPVTAEQMRSGTFPRPQATPAKTEVKPSAPCVPCKARMIADMKRMAISRPQG